MSQHRMLLGILFLLAATMSWGGMFPVAKPALELIDAYWLTSIRYVPSGLVFLLLLALVEGTAALRFDGHGATLFALGTLGFAGFNLLAFTGLAHSRPEHAAVIMATMPMLTMLANWLFKGLKPQTFTLMTIVIAFIGVFLVITGGDPRSAFGGGAAGWDLLILVGGCCWVTYTLGAQRFPSWSPLRYTALTSALGSVSIALITLGMTWTGLLQLPSVEDLVTLRWILAYVIILGALVAVLSWNSGIRMLGAVNGVLFFNVIPITAFTIGVLQGQPLHAVEVLGAMLVIGGLVANNLYQRRSLARAAQAPSNTETVPASAK